MFDVLSKETSILGNWLLEASAGTGKTFTIEHLVSRLMLEEGVPLNQILVITFTRAATRELKMRIRKVLEKQGAIFSEAQIYTIHGFCQKMLQEFALEANVSMRLEAWTEEEEREFAKRFLREGLTSFSPAQLALLLKSCSSDLEALMEELLHTQGSPLPSYDELFLEFQKLKAPPLGELFETAKGSYKRLTESHFPEQCALMERALANPEREAFDALLMTRPFFVDRIEDSNLKVKAPKLPQPLVDFAERASKILRLAASGEALMKRAAFLFQEAKRTESNLKDKISPDDLLQKMQESLQNPHFVKQVRAKYQAAIIDEFQDTDPIQWEIFTTLFLQGGMKATYLVGDPKQSIYSFRKADIYTFLAAKNHPAVTNLAHLSTNYRSGKKIIDALNLLFCATPWIDLPKEKSFLPVPPVHAASSEEGEAHFFTFEGVAKKGGVFPTVEMEERLLFPFIAKKIEEPKKTAVLVKDRFQGARLHAYFKKLGIPSSLQRGKSLAESEALFLFEDLLHAIFSQDPAHQKKARLSPLLHEGGLVDFAELKKVGERAGFGALFAKLSSNLVLTQDALEILEKIVSRNDGAHPLQILEEIKSCEVADRIFAHPEAVQILTIHASKGLEFDTVFALGVASRSQADEEGSAEKMRQLYVALTRAKRRLFIPLSLDSASDPESASPIELFWERVKPDLSSFNHTRLEEEVLLPFPPPNSPPPVPLLFSPPPERKRIYLSSFSSLAKSILREEGFTPSRHALQTVDPLPASAETGVIVHRIFERTLSELTPLAQIVREEVRELAPWAHEIERLVQATLKLDLGGFCLQDVPREKMCQEMEFLFPTPSGFMKGFIDLWFEWEGRSFLVDWKTNLLESYDRASMERAMEEHGYFLQGAIYQEALRRYLKTPVGGAYYLFIRGPAFYFFTPEPFS